MLVEKNHNKLIGSIGKGSFISATAPCSCGTCGYCDCACSDCGMCNTSCAFCDY